MKPISHTQRLCVKSFSVYTVDVLYVMRGHKTLYKRTTSTAAPTTVLAEYHLPEKMTADGGWGWVVTAACFIIHVIIGGITYSCGVLQVIFLRYFDHTHFETAWVVALMIAFTALAGIPGTILAYKVGYRLVVIFGGVLATIGMATAVFCTELYQLYITLGVTTGIGLGMALTPSVLVTESYFQEQRSIATAIAISGVSVGVLSFPLCIYLMEDGLAWKGMALILAGVCMNICLCGLMMKPHSDKEQSRDSLKVFQLSLFRSTAFVTLCICNGLWSFGVSIIYTNLPGYSISAGLSFENATTLVAISGVTSFCSRVIFQLFSKTAKHDVANTFLCTVCATAILTGVFPEMFRHQAGQISYAIILGLHTGFWSTFVSATADDKIGDEYIAYGKGFIIISVAVGSLAGPPTAGWIYDWHGDFEALFYLAGGCLLVSSCLLMLVNLIGCEYRGGLDWVDSESESSISFVKQHLEEEEAILVSSWLSTV